MKETIGRWRMEVDVRECCSSPGMSNFDDAPNQDETGWTTRDGSSRVRVGGSFRGWKERSWK